VLVPDREDAAGVFHSGFDLRPVSDDPGVRKKAADVPGVEAGHPFRVESSKNLAETLPFPQDGQPRKTRLRAFQDEELEERPVVVHGHSPLLVVIGDHPRVAPRPVAPLHRISPVDIIGEKRQNYSFPSKSGQGRGIIIRIYYQQLGTRI